MDVVMAIVAWSTGFFFGALTVLVSMNDGGK